MKLTAVIAKGKFGQRAVLEVTFEDKDTPAPYESVEHLPRRTVRELTWGVEWYDRRGTPDLWDRPASIELEPGWRWQASWNEATYVELAAILSRWHLNGLRAGCNHQTVEYETDRYGLLAPSLDKTPPCPKTGYRYGHAWLCEDLPPDIEQTVVDIMQAASQP